MTKTVKEHEDCGNKRYRGIKKPKCLGGSGCWKCNDIYEAHQKATKKPLKFGWTKKTTRTKKPIDATPQVLKLSETFEDFILQMEALPEDTVRDLRGLIAGYGYDTDEDDPINLIKDGINAWFDGERIYEE